MTPVIAALVAAACAVAVVLLVRGRASQKGRERLARARAEAAAAVRGARLEAAARRRAAETEARAQVLEERARLEAELSSAADDLVRREERLARGESDLADSRAELDSRFAELDERGARVQSLRDRGKGLEDDAAERARSALARLEERGGVPAERVRELLCKRWLDEAHAEAANRIRAVEQATADPAFDREARRMMDIAASRYQNHFLTERNISNIKVVPEVAELLTASDGTVREIFERVSNVTLRVSDDLDAVRLEGLDGVGREVARRALNRLCKKPKALGDASGDPEGWITRIKTGLDREIEALGNKAFKVLDIERPHPDIVNLVGKLNFRTSYTQNQWLHAVEASFLAGMMASELGLDVKLARRATLMHDIGKALTHEIDGSHAVIGADIARRLGEAEIVANAIGAHHADEPPNSIYAYLVAAADAMSGARPGARREIENSYSAKLDDLERIGASFRGVDRAFAVHGGRELRVYVRQGELSDLDVVELSSEIADQIAEEMVFPGQIKVTVIREFEAVATAS
jgi:ribonucrease Y